MKRIVLASASPRRRELIRLITDDVVCIASGEDESLPQGIKAEEVPLYLSKLKGESVAKNYPDSIVIGSDTVVIHEGKILSKPVSEQDAFRKLRSLSGKTHSVITACCVICGGKTSVFSEKTQVEFYELTDEEIRSYIETGEPMDKAGAYGIQGKGSLFVKEIRGDYFNVVGLPVARLYRELKGK